MCGLDPLRNRRGYGHAGQWLQGKHIGAFRPRPFGLKSSCLLLCSFSQNGPIFVKFPVILLQLFVPDPDRIHTCRLDLRLDRAELSLACGSRCGSNGKAARQGPAARLWIQEFESSLGSQESSSNRCVFVVSSLAGIVLKLPRVSYPASASVLTGDAKPLGVGCEWPPGLLRPFSGCRRWSVSSGS